MIDIDCPAESGCFNLYPGNISIGCCIHPEILPCIRFQIKTHVIVVGPKLPEVSTKVDWNIQRVSKISLGVRFQPWLGVVQISNTKKIQEIYCTHEFCHLNSGSKVSG